eukprot:TRINITY_DN58210_c0_g1_i1.p2 TRINITY_DN58210_c0_g1~~TRINITY_DN58210_c0_g1_i1.p2  ORF type:complete len:105 (+),score=0.71 TRINITY_DN58210_c0_g1_i1:499-813(+)
MCLRLSTRMNSVDCDIHRLREDLASAKTRRDALLESVANLERRHRLHRPAAILPRCRSPTSVLGFASRESVDASLGTSLRSVPVPPSAARINRTAKHAIDIDFP